jgi:hypothetical protein
MKNVTLFCLLFLNLSFCLSQETFDLNTKIINKYLCVIKNKNKYFFQAADGEKSIEYDGIQIKENGFLETYIYRPLLDTIIRKSTNRCYIPDNSLRQTFHVLDLMKNMKIIENYSFSNIGELTQENIRNSITTDFGYASKNGKYCMINLKGDFLNDFKFNNPFYDNDVTVINSYYNKKTLVSVVLDQFTGKELFATKKIIVKYWDNQNYILKNKTNFFLFYNGKKQKLPDDFVSLKDMPIESAVFTYDKGFFDFDGKKIKSDFIPLTNFFKGQCIVLDIQKQEPKYNYYQEKYIQDDIKIYKIINEKFETLKILNDFGWLESGFNKYGNVILTNSNDVYNQIVMDYEGNIIIPSSICRNKIKEVFNGLYEVTSSVFPRNVGCLKNENFYNQLGEKILNPETLRIGGNFQFTEGIDENYIYSYSFKSVTLDKENKIINSYYK